MVRWYCVIINACTVERFGALWVLIHHVKVPNERRREKGIARPRNQDRPTATGGVGMTDSELKDLIFILGNNRNVSTNLIAQAKYDATVLMVCLAEIQKQKASNQ